MKKIETPFQTILATVILVVLAFVAACSEPLEAELVGPPQLEQSDDSPADPDIDTDGSADAEPAPETEPYVCLDSDHDGFCRADKAGKVVDFNDSGDDADGDGIVDGTKFYPGASETLCDGLDNDGDDLIDEDAPNVWRFPDTDGDGFGDSSGAVEAVWTCQTQGFADVDGDCNDADSATHPGAEDVPGDGLDTDCDDETAPVDSVQPDEQAYTASAGLVVTLGADDELVLTYQLVGDEEDVGGWWEDVPEITVEDGSRIATEFSVSDRVAFVRLNVTVGRGRRQTWLCTGNGATAALLDGAEATLEVGEGFLVGEPFLWSSPDGQGCSVVFPVSLVH